MEDSHRASEAVSKTASDSVQGGTEQKAKSIRFCFPEKTKIPKNGDFLVFDFKNARMVFLKQVLTENTLTDRSDEDFNPPVHTAALLGRVIGAWLTLAAAFGV